MPSQSKEEWLEGTYRKAVERNPERAESFRTTGETVLDPVYAPEDASANGDLGFPGEYPFTRGVQPTMYRGRLWTMRQYAGFGTAEESNERYRYLLDQGQTGLSVAFDLPTQIGYDSDDSMAMGEVGKVGVAIDSIDDMRTLFKEIPLDRVTTSMTINGTAAVLLGLYIAVGKEQGVPLEKLGGTVQNDILKSGGRHREAGVRPRCDRGDACARDAVVRANTADLPARTLCARSRALPCGWPGAHRRRLHGRAAGGGGADGPGFREQYQDHESGGPRRRGGTDRRRVYMMVYIRVTNIHESI